MTKQITIPQPSNPQHTDNLASIALLDKQGFTGADASLAESVFEYGLCWRELTDGKILFVYRIRSDSEQSRFDRTILEADLDVQCEWNWVKWDSLMSYLGAELKEWLALPLPAKVGDLLSYYGYENIFGTSYWEGFSIQVES
jgi:hypothetical protein